MRNLFVLAVISAFMLSCEKETEEVLTEYKHHLKNWIG